MMTDKFIFLTTPMRSGSSYLSRILSAHPSIAMSYDTVNFFRFCFHRYDPISEPSNLRRLLEDMAFRLLHRFDIKLDVAQCLSIIPPDERSYARAYWSILRTIFPDRGKVIFGDKESMAWTKVPHFLDMFPNGRAIVIVRDPRDVVTSFKRTTIAPGNDYLIALFNIVDAVNHAVRYRLRDPQRVYMVQFERLKLNVEEETRKLCAFLGIDFVPGMLDLAQYTDHSGRKWISEDHMTFPDEKDPLAPVGRWRTKIDPEDLYLCEWIARAQLPSLGLSPSGRSFSQAEFDRAWQAVTSSPLLREALKRWCDSGEGVERCPLDPTDPANWDREWVKDPEAFSNKV